MTSASARATEPRAALDGDRIPADVISLLGRLTEAGHEAHFTGPLLRELAAEPPAPTPTRVEIITSARSKALRRLVSQDAELSAWLVPGESARALVLRVPAEGGSRTVTLSPYRDQAPPTRWFREQRFEGLVLDLATREITAHAFCADARGELVDPFGGLLDWQRRTLRPIPPAARVFRESGLWLLKLPRYVARYGFATPPDVMRAAKRDAVHLLDAPRRLWKPQLDRLLLGDFVMDGLEWLHQAGALPYLMPEVESMIGFHQSCVAHHKDLWDHTKQVIDQAEKNLVVRWAALMHDIGKVWTRTVTREGKVHFFRHEDLGALLFEGVAARLLFTAQETEEVSYVIRQHSRVNLYDETWTDSAVRRLIRECGDRLENLVAFSRADFTTKRVSRRDEIVRQLDELERRLAEIRAEDARVPPLPKGLGTAIAERFGIPPSKRIGDLRGWLEAEAEAGRIEGQQPVEYYLDHLCAHAEALGLEAH